MPESQIAMIGGLNMDPGDVSLAALAVKRSEGSDWLLSTVETAVD